MLPFKKDSPTNHHKDVGNIPSVQDSSTGVRHTLLDQQQGQLLGTKEKNMNLKKKKIKNHSKKYYEDIDHAKLQIKNAEKDMKKMDTEVKEFHNHMANSMQLLMKAFTDGFTALEKAKRDEKLIEEKQEPASESQLLAAAADISTESKPVK